MFEYVRERRTVYILLRRWLYNISRGIDKEPVQIKLISKSIGCCKRFPGRTALCKPDEVEHWIKELSSEISERLEEDARENNRKGRLMTVSFAQEMNQAEVSNTRAVQLKSHELDKICQSALEVLKKNCQKSNGSYHVTFLGLSVGNFESIKNVRSIESYFRKADKEKIITETVNNSSAHPENIDEREEIPAHDSSGGIIDGSVINKSESDYSNRMEKYKIDSSCGSKNLMFNNPNKQMHFTRNLLNGIDCNLKEPELEYNAELNLEETSNYSDSTIALDESPDELIFYDDGFRADESSSFNDIRTGHNQTLGRVPFSSDYLLSETDLTFPLARNTSISSIESLENERYLDCMSPKFNNRTPEKGFFTKHLEHPWKRDFDTSKILLDIEPTDSENTDESIGKEINLGCSVTSELTSCDLFETCTECGDSISITEIVSHMDYHLALKLSKEISPLKKHSVDIVHRNGISEKHPRKRKAEHPVKNSITSFFKRDEFDPDEPTEVCPECKKKIKLTDFEDHNDYHAAKKLHLELNKPMFSYESENEPTSKEHIRPNAIQNLKSTKSIPNIISFFKKKSS